MNGNVLGNLRQSLSSREVAKTRLRERAKRLEKKELMQPECDKDGGRAVKYETRSSNPRILVRSHPNLPTKYKTIGRNNTFPLFDISGLQSSFSVENSGKNDF